MTKPIIHWRTMWYHGTRTHIVTFWAVSDAQRAEIEAVADGEGYERDGEFWTPPASPNDFFEIARLKGFDLEFGREDEDERLNLHRLYLTDETRKRLEATTDFTLWELAGYCPVQAEGEVDGLFFYFRAREAYWRFECGGSTTGSRGPRWWYEEEWPGETGLEAGYMSDEDAICCILKSVEAYRTTDRSRFESGHPDFGRTILEGWAMGALSLQRAVRRLAISGEQAIERAKTYGIALPYLAQRELEALDNASATVIGRDPTTGNWVELEDEDNL
ncbi:hypothetical protein [Rhizobium rhizogenes]|uniref:hypothetical protein n=1 Tax=Rhizobium rhizogenes TaxID=359 RepID=UPI00157229A4|nr:hypothetical protein [Rhizobium rhizogenes]NTF49107.1 hypothetical protein [Rhizobium rhizogenes]NTH06491.1 hypothetical protein [Rhizobium rhizogenes]